MSAFANSDGGFVVLGVSEAPKQKGGKRSITGAKAPGGAALDDWASSTVLEIASHFSIQPRFQVVKHPKGDVLVCATARSAQLVPVIESRRWKYFIRTHDSTIEAPAYLLSDLVLGRRNHPVIGISLHGVSRSTRTVLDAGGYVLSQERLNFSFSLENLSLLPADDICVGMVSWQASHPGARSTVSERLRYYVEEATPQQPVQGPQLNWILRHVCSTDPFALNTFGRGNLVIREPLVVPDNPRLNPVSRAGVYVLPKGVPPTWYQLTCATSGFSSDPEKAQADARRLCRLEPATRPTLHWARNETFT